MSINLALTFNLISVISREKSKLIVVQELTIYGMSFAT